MERDNIGVACIYAPNIPLERRHLWHIMVDLLPKDCDWILGGGFNMTERVQDKSKDCGRAISDLKIFTWGELLNAFQVQDKFVHQGGPRFSWNNGQHGQARRLARLNRFYTPNQSRLEIHHTAYFIHGYSVGSDHSPVQIELNIENGEVRKSTFKWNISHLQGEICDTLSECWNKLLGDTSFFSKIRYISRVYRQESKKIARGNKREELDTRANLEITVANLHEDIYNANKQREVNELRQTLDGIETRKASGAAIRARVKWQKLGDKCSAEFFKSVRQKIPNALMTELKNNHGRIFTRQEDLQKICYEFYKKTLPT